MIDTFARRILGWRVSRTAHASLVLDALERALRARRPAMENGLVHHLDRGSQCLSIRYTERLAKAGIEPSVGRVGGSYDNALAERGSACSPLRADLRFKTERVGRRGAWRSFKTIELATLARVDRFDTQCLLGPVWHVPTCQGQSELTHA